MAISFPRSLTKSRSTRTTVAVETDRSTALNTITPKSICANPQIKRKSDDELLWDYEDFDLGGMEKLDLAGLDETDSMNLEGFGGLREVMKGDIVENTRGENIAYNLDGSDNVPVRKAGGLLWKPQEPVQISENDITKWATKNEVINHDVRFDTDDAAVVVELDSNKVAEQFARLRRPEEGTGFEDGIDPSLSFPRKQPKSYPPNVCCGVGETPRSEALVVSGGVHVGKDVRLADLILGLYSDFCPGINHLSNPIVHLVRTGEAQVSSLQLAGENNDENATDSMDESTTELIKIYYGLNDRGAGPHQQNQHDGMDYLVDLGDVQSGSNPYTFEDEDMEETGLVPVSFYDISTQQEVGYTALNQLLQQDRKEFDAMREGRGEVGATGNVDGHIDVDLDDFNWLGMEVDIGTLIWADENEETSWLEVN